MSDLTQRIIENVAGVRESITEAAQRSGRRGEDVTVTEKLAFPVQFLVDQHECAAANPGTLRLDQPQHRVGSNGGIHRAAAGFEHIQCNLGGERLAGGDASGRVQR